MVAGPSPPKPSPFTRCVRDALTGANSSEHGTLVREKVRLRHFQAGEANALGWMRELNVATSISMPGNPAAGPSQTLDCPPGADSCHRGEPSARNLRATRVT